MASKMVTDRQKSAEAVAALSQAQSTLLSEVLTQRLRVDGSLTVQQLLDRLLQSILDARNEMVDRDTVHEAELADDPAARDARDQAARSLASLLVELREIVIGLYGQQIAATVFSSAVPSDPVALERFADAVAAQLQRVSLGTSRVAGAAIDTSSVAQQLQDQRQVLNERLSDVAREVREAQTTLVAKNAAIADYDRTFTGIATIFEGLFILADQKELAARVRPSRRRPGQTIVDEPPNE